MATLTIQTTDLAVLNNTLDKLLDHADLNRPPRLAPDEYTLINELRNAVTTGERTGANTVSSIVINY